VLELTKEEKQFIAVGLCLAADLLKLNSIKDEHTTITLLSLEIVQKLKLEKEHGKACVETAEIGKLFAQAREMNLV
jgi:hypothetical protein